MTFFLLPYLAPTLVATEGLPPYVRAFTGWELATWDVVGYGQPTPYPIANALWLTLLCAVATILLFVQFVRRPSRRVAVGLCILGLGVVISQALLLTARSATGDGLWSAAGIGYWLTWAASAAIIIGGVALATRRTDQAVIS